MEEEEAEEEAVRLIRHHLANRFVLFFRISILFPRHVYKTTTEIQSKLGILDNNWVKMCFYLTSVI